MTEPTFNEAYHAGLTAAYRVLRRNFDQFDMDLRAGRRTAPFDLNDFRRVMQEVSALKDFKAHPPDKP